MSNSQSVTNVNDIVTTTNTVIQENLSKLNEKLSIIKNDIIEDEDDEYENFYNRINFYFSTIISELKLNFLESLKKSQKNETLLEKENQILKQRIESDEKDILNLIMENMLLKIENESLEEKNMINISHYVDASPEALSEKSNGSLERKMQTSQKTKKSRNKSNINITTTTEDLSFKTELRNNINLKIKKRMAEKAIPHNNSSSSNIDIKKKSNLINFLSHANVINKNTNYNSIQTINNIKSISPKGKKRAQTGHHQHYKSFNNENNILSGEKSMCNLPSYSLGKVKIGDSRMKTSLNDLGVSTNMNGKSYSKGKFIKIISSSTNKQKKPNSVSKKSITKGFSNKSSYNILGENNSGLSNDFEKYKSNLMSKIGFTSNTNSGSNNNTGFNYLCNHNIKGIMNIKMNTNK